MPIQVVGAPGRRYVVEEPRGKSVAVDEELLVRQPCRGPLVEPGQHYPFRRVQGETSQVVVEPQKGQWSGRARPPRPAREAGAQTQSWPNAHLIRPAARLRARRGPNAPASRRAAAAANGESAEPAVTVSSLFNIASVSGSDRRCHGCITSRARIPGGRELRQRRDSRGRSTPPGRTDGCPRRHTSRRQPAVGTAAFVCADRDPVPGRWCWASSG